MAQTNFHNADLAALEQQIEAGVPAQLREDYQKIVVAGMKAGLKGGPNSILAQLRNSKDPLNDCVKGAVNLTSLLRRMSRNTMPIRAMIPAAMTLMLQALDFADRMGMVKVGKPEIAQATKLFADLIFQANHITNAQLQQVAQKTQGVMNNPQQLQALRTHMKGVQ